MYRTKLLNALLRISGIKKVYDVNAILIVVDENFSLTTVIKKAQQIARTFGLEPTIERNEELKQFKLWL